MLKLPDNWRAIFHLRSLKSTDKLKPDSARFSNAVGTCLDNSSRLTFLQADFERIASAQANASEDAATQMGCLRSAMGHALNASQETRVAADMACESSLQVARDAEQTELHMQSVRKSIEDSQTLLKDLSSRSTNIEQIVQSIEKIARETTLLAMNAKIEAARAGASGRGFAVVADAVKSLAVQTNEATLTIQKLLGATVSDVRRARGLIDHAMHEVSISSGLAKEMAHRSADAKQQAEMVDSKLVVVVGQFDAAEGAAQSVDQRVKGLADGAQQITATASQAREAARCVLESAIVLKRHDQSAQNHGRTPVQIRLLNLTEIARGETVLALNAEPLGVERAQQRIRQVDEALNLVLAQGSSRAMTVAFDVLWQEYCALREQALDLAASGRNAEAIAFTAKRNRPKYQELRKFLNEWSG